VFGLALTLRFRCNACGQIFAASEPQSAGDDKYDVTAVAMIALLKYATGVPFKRLERLEGQLGIPLPAATQWELVAAAAKLLRPVLEELIRQAVQGSVMHNDDTHMRILQLKREPGDQRTGTFTSGIVSVAGTRRIALFFAGSKHAGENIAAVLKRRARELPAPIQMCDALSRNTPKLAEIEILLANCLAHGRRQFVELVQNSPQECRYVLETLSGVYHNDALAREQRLSPEDRLRFHQEHSGPLMKELHDWMEAQLAEHKTEPNSGLGKAISYLLNHWTKLTLFLRQPGAPIDNTAPRLEHRGALGGQAPVIAGPSPRSGRGHRPLRQPTVSPTARRSRRLPASHPRARRFPFSPLRGHCVTAAVQKNTFLVTANT